MNAKALPEIHYACHKIPKQDGNPGRSSAEQGNELENKLLSTSQSSAAGWSLHQLRHRLLQ